MNDILAIALGRAISKRTGLRRLELPRSLPNTFLQQIVENACTLRSEQKDFALIVSQSPDEQSNSQSARNSAKYRLGDRILVHWEDDFSTISTLDTFRPLLTDMHPDFGSDSSFRPAELSVDQICIEIVNLILPEASQDSLNTFKSTLSRALTLVAEVMSLDAKWVPSWWEHLRITSNNLSSYVKQYPDGTGSVYPGIIFAALGLPQPHGEDWKYSQKITPARFHSYFQDYWDSAAAVEVSIAAMELMDSNTDFSKFRQLNWSSIDESLISRDNHIAAFWNHGAENERDSSQHLKAWANVSEQHFFYALNNASEGEVTFQIKHSDLPQLNDDPWFLLPIDTADREEHDDGTIFRFEDFSLKLTSSHKEILTPRDLLQDNINITFGSDVAHYNIISAAVVDGILEISGELVIDIATKKKWSNKPYSVTFEFDDARLAAAFQPKVKPSLFLPSPEFPTIFLRRKTGRDKLSPVEVINLETSDDSYIYDPKTANRVYAAAYYSFPPTTSHSLQCGSECGETRDNWPYFSCINNIYVDPDTTLTVGEYSVKFIINNEVEFRPVLPLLATAKEVPPSDEVLPNLEDIRATLEEHFYPRFTLEKLPDEFRSSLGQLVVPINDKQIDIQNKDDIELADGGAFWPTKVSKPARRLPHSGDLCDHCKPAQLVDFWQAFESLRLKNICVRTTTDSDNHKQSFWISRTSLLKIPAKAIEGYVSAYHELLKSADKSSSNAKHWLAHPFSVILVDADKNNKFCGLFLSPLHPIRLAWLWLCEHAIELAANNGEPDSGLLQLISGWNFPMVSPSVSETGKRVTLAIPIDTGHHDLFMGWSFLCDFDNQTGAVPELPQSIAGLPLPGASSSGVSAGSVGAAFRDYLKVYPFVSTITIDLAAETQVPRMTKMDDAIISELLSVANNSKTTGLDLHGGVRIWDSSNRIGEAPTRDKILRRTKNEIPFPFTWQHYVVNSRDHNELEPSIRFQQDVSSAVSIDHDAKTMHTKLSPVFPLRRFLSRNRKEDSLFINLNQVSHPDCPVPSFSKALMLLEGCSADSQPQLKIKRGGSLISRDAYWTILGDTYLDPVSLNTMIRERGSGTAQRLVWEWRPPYASRRSDDQSTLFERRPYVSIAKIPPSFKNLLASRIKTVLPPDSTGEPDCVEMVIRLLGERGIGLSSLLAMGHQHEFGALGFYFALKLCDKWITSRTVEKTLRFVVPLDAINSLLCSITGESEEDTPETQRADLLAIDINFEADKPSVNLIAIEIKNYGVQSESAQAFPSSTSKQVLGAVKQLESTVSLLSKITTIDFHNNPKDNSFYTTGLATLLDTAFMLGPDDRPDDLEALLLQNLFVGNFEITVAKGVLLWFQTNGGHQHAYVGPERRQPTSEEHDEHIELFIDPKKIPEGLWGETHHRIHDVFKQAMDSSISSNKSSSTSDPSTTLPEANSGIGTANPVNPPRKPTAPPTSPPPPPKAVTVRVPTKKPNNNGSKTTKPPPPPPPNKNPASPNRIETMNIRLGTIVDNIPPTEAKCPLNNTDLNQLNIGIVGDLGTGKTQLLKSLLYQLSNSGPQNRNHKPKLLILDYKGDFGTKDELFSNNFDCEILKPENIPLNFFSLEGCGSHNPKYERARSFFSILKKLYSGIGAVQEEHFINAVMQAYQTAINEPTLYDVLRTYKELVPKADSISSALNSLTLSGVLEQDPAKLKSFPELFDKTLVVNLSSLGTDKQLKNALVTIFLNFYFEYMLRLKKQPFTSTDDGIQTRFIDSFLLIDEAHNTLPYNFPVLKELLLQGREFGVGVILASQYLSHFGKSNGGVDWAECLNTWVIHKVPKTSVGELSNLGITNTNKAMANQVSSYKKFNALYKDMNGHGRQIETLPFYKLMEELGIKEN